MAIVDQRARIRWTTTLFLSIVLIANLIGVYLNANTFDAGDSILHYIYAGQALHYPGYFFHHWAKPFFVLLASPFTALGWTGMKIFNTLCVIGSLCLVGILYRGQSTDRLPALQRVAWVLPLGLLMPDLFMVQSSGLTEPLFALVLTAGLLLYWKDHQNWAMVLWSFLPFVRSEGWIILPVLALLIAFDKRYKQLPLLILGTVLYSIAGSGYHHDLLWVFHENPYSGVEPKYGSGSWLHYLDQLPYAMGLPLFALLCISSVVVCVQLLQGKIKWRTPVIWALVLFWSFFSAHTIFWAMGWFHSFGLRRVFIAVLPLSVIPSVHIIRSIKGNQVFHWARIMILILIFTFPFSGNKMGLGLPESLNKDVSLICADRASQWFVESEYNNSTVCYAQHYLTMALDRDMDNTDSVRIMEPGILDELDEGTMVFWDSYFSESDKGISEKALLSDPNFKLIQEFSERSSDKNHRISIYRKMR